MKTYSKIIAAISVLTMLISGCSSKKNNKQPSDSVESQTSTVSSETTPSMESESESTSSVESTSEVTPTSESESTSASESSEEEKFTIIWKNYDGTVLETDTNVVKGSTPSYDGANPVRADDAEYEYTWSGWTPEVGPVVTDQTYTATFSRERIQYTINFDLGGGSSLTWDGQSKSVTAFTKDVFFFDVVKADWNFRGWSYNNTKIFDEKGNQLANPVMAKNMTFIALFSQTVKLEISVNIPNAGTVSGEGEYPFNTNVDLVATPSDGYNFVGWFVNGTIISSSENYNFKMWSDDVVMEAQFMSDMHALKIESNNATKGLVAIQNGASTNYVKENEEQVPYTKQVTVVAYSLDETRFLGWFDEDNELVATNAIYSFVMPNEDCHLIAKWNYFTVEYVLNGGNNDLDNIEEYTVEDSNFTLKNPSKEDNVFKGWWMIVDDEVISKDCKTINTSDMVNITLVADWCLSLGALLCNISDPRGGQVEVVSGTGQVSAVTKLRAKVEEGYTFLGWNRSTVNVITQPATNNEISIGVNTSPTTVNAYFVRDEEIGKKINQIDNKHVTYGFYPQDRVTDNNLITELNNNALSCYLLNNYLYKGVFYQEIDSIWYKMLPVSWIKCNDSGYYLAEKVLYAEKFGNHHAAYDDGFGNMVYSNNYNESSIISKLALMGLDMFSIDKSKVVTSTIDNSVNQHRAKNDYTKHVEDSAGVDLFLPSYKEITFIDYGFKKQNDRACEYTGYSFDLTGSFADGACYWTRSPSRCGEDYVEVVDFTNGAIYQEMEITSKVGIRPAVYLQA